MVWQSLAAVEIHDADYILADGERQAEDRLEPEPHDAVGGGLPRLAGGDVAVDRPAGRGDLFGDRKAHLDLAVAVRSPLPADEPIALAEGQTASLRARESHR